MLKPDQTIYYLNIKEGRIYYKDKPYKSVSGLLKDIRVREREFNGETVKYWYINLLRENGEDIYSLALHYSSGVAKTILNSLASATDLSKPITIETYQKDNYSKAIVSSGRDKLSWKYPPAELPPIETVQIGSRTIKDDSKRMSFFEEIAEKLNSRVSNQATKTAE